MKTTIKLLSLFVSFIQIQYSFGNPLSFKNKDDSLVYLEIRGKAIIKEKSNNKIYKVILLENNKAIDSVVGKNDEQFVFGLLKNRYYALKVYKLGYLPKLIIINTYIPEKKYLTDYFIFDFETVLINNSEEEKLNPDTKDFPLAIVQFDNEKQAFNYNQLYSKNIKLHLYNK